MDMALKLSVVSYHRLSPNQADHFIFDRNGGTLGRSADCHWHLPDPERILSSTHASIASENTHFFITDCSTNGLFINRAVSALGKGNRHQLQAGDHLSLGDYELEVSLIDEAVKAEPGLPTSTAHNGSTLQTPAGVALGGISTKAFSASSTNLSAPVTATVASAGMGELALDDHLPLPSATIPEDWHFETSTAADTALDLSAEVATSAPPASSVVAAEAVARPAPSATVDPAKSVQAAVTPATGQMQAFLQGLGLSDATAGLPDSPQLWHQLGAAMQQLLMGLVVSLRQRAEFKQRFRVNQTTFQAQENNPLKFSATIDDVIANLFLRSGSSFMSATRAINEAYADLNRHDDALLAGTQGAVEGLLSLLDPQKLAQRDFGNHPLDKLIPAREQARCWTLFSELHQDVKREQRRQPLAGVQDEFIKAYEKQLRSE